MRAFQVRGPTERPGCSTHCWLFRDKKVKSGFRGCHARAANPLFPERLNTSTCLSDNEYFLNTLSDA